MPQQDSLVWPPSRLPIEVVKHLRLPVIGAPMLTVSGPELVAATCRVGAVGAFPTLNARAPGELDSWLAELCDELGETSALICPNLIMPSDRLQEDVETILRHGINMVITSVGSPAPVLPQLREAGVFVLSDVASMRHAQKAADIGVDGMVLLGAGAGGQTGWLNPLAYVRAVRDFFDGPVVLSGGISDGTALAAARVLGCDLGYIGTRLIAATESRASDEYRQMLVSATPDEIVLSKAFDGYAGSWLLPSILAAGLDPDRLDEDATPNQADVLYGSGGSQHVRRWTDIWSAGHSVGGVRAVESAAQILERTGREYKEALCRTLGHVDLSSA